MFNSAWSIPEFFGSGSEFRVRIRFRFQSVLLKLLFLGLVLEVRFYGSHGSLFCPKIAQIATQNFPTHTVF